MHLSIVIQVYCIKEVSDQPKVAPNLVPIAHFSNSFSKTTAVEHYPTGLLCSLSVHSKIFILPSRHEIHTAPCDQKPLALFFTTGMSSPVLDCWALELQQYNIQFEHISGKKNVVADTIYWLKTLGLYQQWQ